MYSSNSVRIDIAITADIKEMFMNILVDPKDQPYLRFLHRDQATKELKIYQATRHIFGLCSSPFIAVEIVRAVARRSEESLPLASKAVLGSTLVDDVLTSVRTHEEIQVLDQQLKAMLMTLGMDMHKKTSNYREFMDTLPDGQKASYVEIEPSMGSEEPGYIRALGLIYETFRDKFTFRYSPTLSQLWTLRLVVSFAGRLYDPLGFLGPFLVISKLIIQAMFRAGREWDEEVPPELERKWKKWLIQAPQVATIQIERWTHKTARVQLHVFADASAEAFACVAYAVSLDEATGERMSSFVMSKNRVAPIRKQESVARLELSGAHLAVLLGEKLAAVYEVPKSEILYWTDSTTVLYWLHSKQVLPTFVANRVCNILDRSAPHQWRHVSSADNAADCATRGFTVEQLRNSALWWHGPSFLLQDPQRWAPQPPCTPTEEALREMLTLEQVVRRFNFSNLGEVLHPRGKFLLKCLSGTSNIIAMLQGLLRAVKAFVPSSTITFGGIISPLIAEVQREALGTLLSMCRNQTKLPKQYAKLSPFCDQKGLLRVGGRLTDASMLTFDERHPVILPKNHRFTELVVLYLHEKILDHVGGPLHLLQTAQKHFWVFGGRKEMARILGRCHRCKCREPQALQPQMAPLHHLRLPTSEEGNLRPFLKVGVDLAGPWETRARRTRGSNPTQKRYLIIFVCGNVRAIHAEMVWSSSTESFLMAFDRFAATRGTPEYLMSDRGGNFIAGEQELRDLMFKWNRTYRRPFKWVFNPAYSPEQGGNYERLIRSLKQALYHSLETAQTILMDEELMTAFKHVERLLNQRPLTVVSEDPRDPIALTPQDFLVGSRNTLCPEAERPIPCNLNQRWHVLQNLTRKLWRGICCSISQESA